MDDPYEPPRAELSPTRKVELATLTARLVGALIDAVVAVLVAVPLYTATGVFEDLQAGAIAFSKALLVVVLSFLGFVLVHGRLLATRGQTIGKLVVGTQIVSVTDQKILPLGRLLLYRYVPLTLAGLVPVIGNAVGIANVLLIFREDRRCIHDHLAGTMVINYRTASYVEF